MGLTAWCLFYGIELIFWIWIIRWGGAERLEGTFSSGFLLHMFAPRWSADGIKLFAWLMMIVSTIWFAIGLFNPGVRIY